jgi:Flp pilus assembly protein TadD
MGTTGSTTSSVTDRCAALDPTALRVLRLMALLAPVPLERAIWRTAAEDEAALARLQELSLVTACPAADGEPAHCIDEALQRDVCAAIPAAELQAWVHDALRLVDAYTPSDTDDPRRWARMRRILPHIEKILERAEEHAIPEPTGLLMGEKLGVYLYLIGQQERAEQLFRRALAIDEAHYGPDDPRIAPDLDNLAVALDNAGTKAESEALITRAVTILLPHEATRTVSLTVAMGVLAGALQERGMLTESEGLRRLALEIGQRHLPPDSISIARDLRLLAGLLLHTERAAEAEPLAERALQIDEGQDPLNPFAADDLRLLAAIYAQTDPTADIVALLDRALELNERWLAASHARVLRGLNELATLCDAKNLAERAVGYRLELLTRATAADAPDFEHIVSLARDLVESTDPRVPDALRDLAKAALARRLEEDLVPQMLASAACTALRKRECWDEAQALELDVKETILLRRIEGDADDADAWNALGLFMKNERRNYDEAERAYRRAVELAPDSSTAVFNLGLFLTRVRGRNAEAEPLLRRALQLDPHDARVISGCAFFFHHELDRAAEAEPLLEQAVALAPEDSCTLANLACLRIVQARNNDARELIERAAKVKNDSSCLLRTLFLGTALERLEGKDASTWITRIKTELQRAPELAPWNPRRLMELLRERLPEEEQPFFLTLQTVLFPSPQSSATAGALDAFAPWTSGIRTPVESI